MFYSIQYVYGKDKNEKEVLEGAKVISFDGRYTFIQEIYVGLEFSLDDILNNSVNAHAIGVKNLEVFKNKYEKLGAVGVIYFPGTDKYEFLEAGDIVIPWVSSLMVQKSLEAALKPYRKSATESIVKERMAAYVDHLGAENPLVELNDLSLNRHVSNR